jgi:autotransporter-associated beta strand protein
VGSDLFISDSTINSAWVLALAFTGAGVINDSGTTQNFVATEAGGHIVFDNHASAGSDVVFTTVGNAFGGGKNIEFRSAANGGNATLIAQGSDVAITHVGEVTFSDESSAANATVIAEAGPQGGGIVSFMNNASADNATLIANSGDEGGSIEFSARSSGGTPRVILNGNGTGDARDGELSFNIDSSDHPPFTIGSLEGDGLLHVTRGAEDIEIGNNNLSTTFGGRVTGPATITKVGTGTLTLTNGGSTYFGGTNVNQGALLVSNTTGLGAGGPIEVNGGTLGGTGTVAGPVTVGTGSGTGAFLAPARGTKRQSTFTIQSSLTFKADSTYVYSAKAKNQRFRTDLVVAGGVTIESGATFSLRATIRGPLAPGTVFTAISNTAATPIAGTFSNLPDGGLISAGGVTFKADYQGGDGNELTLTVQ